MEFRRRVPTQSGHRCNPGPLRRDRFFRGVAAWCLTEANVSIEPWKFYLSLIGIPLTAGFVSKWYLILGALDKDWWWLAALILLSSLLAIIYVWRIIEVAYLRAPPEGAQRSEAPLPLLIPTWVLALANIYFGIDTRVSVGIAETAATFLMSVK